MPEILISLSFCAGQSDDVLSNFFVSLSERLLNHVLKGPVHHSIEPWYLAYAIVGALASGLAAILIPLVVTNSGGSSTQLGVAIAALGLFNAAAAAAWPLALSAEAPWPMSSRL